MFERAEENMMIEARFDPVEWRHEVDAVYKDLVNIQKDIDLARQRGGGEVSEESQGLEGARKMFQTSQRLEEVL